MGFIIHFYITFGTNLLTGGPAQICCFMPISVFRGKGISDRVKTERNQLEKLILEGNPPDRLGVHVRGVPGCPRGWGRAHPPRERPPTSCLPRFFLDVDSKSPGSYSSKKSRCRRFHSVWTPFDIPFLRNIEIGNKTAIWAGPLVNRLVPKK